MNVFLITASNEIIKKVLEIFASGKITGKHQVKMLDEPPGQSGSAFEDGFLIADVCSGIRQDGKLFLFLKSHEIAEFPKLLIVDKTVMLSDLFGNGVKINDFVFKENLDTELATRIETIFLRDFKLNSSKSIVIGDIVLDLDKYELLINGKKIELTFKEYELLKILLENKNKVFTRTQLLSAVWDYDYYGGSRTVDVHMRRLRSKIDLPYSNMLKTIRNVGYMFSPEM